MAIGYRIPRGIEEFNPFIINTNIYLADGEPTNATRLGFVPAETAQWNAFANDWEPLYIKYSDKKASRTTAIKDQLLAIIDECLELDQNNRLLDRIAASPNVTILDMETFNIRQGVLQKETHSVPQTPIVDPVLASIQPIGGGSFSIKCNNGRRTRAAIFEDADSVQYTYLVGDVAPASPEVVGLTKEISTRAGFTLALGAENSEKHLYIYFRWYLTSYPNFAGPWSSLYTSLIL